MRIIDQMPRHHRAGHALATHRTQRIAHGQPAAIGQAAALHAGHHHLPVRPGAEREAGPVGQRRHLRQRPGQP